MPAKNLLKKLVCYKVVASSKCWKYITTIYGFLCHVWTSPPAKLF